MNWFARWRRTRILARHAMSPDDFDAAAAALPILQGLDTAERTRLREAASLFIHDKTFSAAGGAEVDAATRHLIALQACLLTLNLSEDSYRGWSEIILYPEEFLRQREETDEAGVVHHSRDILAGESWHGGPLVLSIADVAASGQADGFNVVLHEFAHKLDMLNGDANGFPPLHRGMDAAGWARDFTTAYEDLCARVDADEDTVIDPYAATDPAEFFAVLTEVFFETPQLLHTEYPAVYRQLQQFYRQHPLVRLAAHAHA
ncbi:MAG: zinc-dependent peptidase [Thiobacillus sp.]|nr:zinc-dependent peptidase [Thiobacillus sp.]